MFLSDRQEFYLSKHSEQQNTRARGFSSKAMCQKTYIVGDTLKAAFLACEWVRNEGERKQIENQKQIGCERGKKFFMQNIWVRINYLCFIGVL